MLCLIYDGSFNGFLCAVFDAYKSNDTEIAVLRSGAPLPGLFNIREVVTDTEKSNRVAAGAQRLDRDLLKSVYRAWLSEIDGIDDDVLRTLRLGFSLNKDPMPMRYEPCVLRVGDAERKVINEVVRYESFVRFVIAGDDLFIADIEPQFDILPLIGRHFHLRYASQRFIIRDLKRKRAIISDSGGWHIAELAGAELSPVGKGGEFELMWRRYFTAVANQSRINPKLQQKFIPLRYRRYLTEFQ